MNAEGCKNHKHLIDDPGPDGIYYPWVCDCPDSECMHPWDRRATYPIGPDYGDTGMYCLVCGEDFELE